MRRPVSWRKGWSILALCVFWILSPWSRADLPFYSFSVAEWAGVGRTNEVLRSGLPLPRQAGVTNVNQLRVRRESGEAVPARWYPLARWNAGLNDASAPLQWVLLEMPVSVSAKDVARFYLQIGAAPFEALPVSSPLSLTETNGSIVIDTGAATFTLGNHSGQLFESIRVAGQAVSMPGRPMSAMANSNSTVLASGRRMQVEKVSELAAVVVLDDVYDLPLVGNGGLGSSRRYEFFAGSPVVLIRHEVAWEGELAGLGALDAGGVPNGVRLQGVRDPVAAPFAGPCEALAWGAFSEVPTWRALASGQTASLHQQLRERREASRRFTLDVGDFHQTGLAANGGLLAVSDGQQTLAVALNHMACYEPQALRWLADGSLAADIVAGSAWLGARQGLYAQMGVAAMPGQASFAGLQSQLWAKLNYPLRAWPSAAWFAAAETTDEFPAGTLPSALTGYDTLIPTILNRTTNLVDQLGLYGVQTHGLFPRYWGNPAQAYDELTNSVADPTPSEPWDDVYWGATWTDYHNTSALATYWAMRSGTAYWLDEIGAPAAWRMLHTQIIHGAPDDDYFYIGQAPCGYGGYRADFNSSHAYFENLQLYYWLSGDYTVVETLQRGAAAMRAYYCPGRPGVAIDPLLPASNEYDHPVGRVASQWISVFRFVGLAGDDASFLEDYRGNLARAVSQYYAELEVGGRRCGLWCSLPVAAGVTNHTDQIWMLSDYDLNNLNRWRVDSGDAPLGSPPLRPSEILSAWGRSLTYLMPHLAPEGNGTAQGQWPNWIQFTYTGDRLGGSVQFMTNYFVDGVDNFLWDSGKACLCAVTSRAADFTGDAAIRQLASDLAQLSLRAAWNQGTPPPLGKEQGLYLSRLHPAIHRLSQHQEARMQIGWQNGQLRLSWPGIGQDWWLDSSPTIGPQAVWTELTNGYDAGSWPLPSLATPQAYYRLRLPLP